MLTKFDSKEAKEKMRKQKHSLEQQIEDVQKSLRGDVDATEKRLAGDIGKFEETVRDVERYDHSCELLGKHFGKSTTAKTSSRRG